MAKRKFPTMRITSAAVAFSNLPPKPIVAAAPEPEVVEPLDDDDEDDDALEAAYEPELDDRPADWRRDEIEGRTQKHLGA